jgi:hypothetical protein
VLRGKSIEILGYTNNALTPSQRADALGAILSHAAGGSLAVEHVEVPLSQVEQAWNQTKDGGGQRPVVTM